MSHVETVGTLLADIANFINDGLRILSFADKRQWGLDEHEQVRALQEVLDDAKKDFQELSPLANGQFHYERDRKYDTIAELQSLCSQFQAHVQNLKDWARSGGPINPIWVRDTKTLQRQLHRAQCRAARRIFMAAQEASTRCLGAFLVHRVQRSWVNKEAGISEGEYKKRYLDELLACQKVGSFERFGEHDIAFVCDFCDGHLVWEDLANMPNTRTAEGAQADVNSPTSPVSATTQTPHWQATGLARSDRQEKQVVFAPVAIANHIAPVHRDWQARLLCPFCEEEGRKPLDEDDDEDEYRPDGEFEDVTALQEHLAWQHSPSTNTIPATVQNEKNCLVM